MHNTEAGQSATLNAIGALYSAPDERTLAAKAADLQFKFTQVEVELSVPGRAEPYFTGDSISMVDAAFAPLFRYFDVFEATNDFDVFAHTPRVNAWRSALQQRPSVRSAVRADYPKLLHEFLIQRRSELSRRMVQVDHATT